MAQLKDSLVQGSLRVTDTIFTNTLDVTNFAQVGKILLGVGNSSSSADANSRTISVTSDNLILEVPTGIVFRKSGTIGMRIDGKTLYPENDKTDGYTLGTSSKKWYKVYTQTLVDSGDALWIKTESSNSIIFSINSVDKCRIDTNGYFKPETDNTLSIGTSTNRWANIYATKFNNLTLTAATTGFTIAGGTTSKTLTVSETYTLGAACAKGVVDRTSVSSLTNVDTWANNANLPTVNLIAYWDGRYLKTSNKSNLAYCVKGAFGDMAIKTKGNGFSDSSNTISVAYGTAANTAVLGNQTIFTLNGGAKNSGSSASFYAPTGGGTAGYILKAGGASTAPDWILAVPIANGGTGKTTAADAWSALGGGASGKHADSYFIKAITSTDEVMVRFNSTAGLVLGSRMSINDTGLITVSYNGRYPGDTQFKNAAGTVVGERWLDLGNGTNVTSPRFYWRVWRPKATADTGVNTLYEQFRLPAANSGTADNVTYEILTSKSKVTVAQGGTGAGTFTSGALLIGNGTDAIGTRAITDRTALSSLTNVDTWANSTNIPTVNLIAYWDGRYLKTSNKSNLTYLNKRVNFPTITGGTGVTASDLGASANPRYRPASWKFDAGISPIDGDVVTVKKPSALNDYGTWLSLDNGTTWYPIVYANTSRVPDWFSNNYSITLRFDSVGTCSVFGSIDTTNKVILATNERQTVTGVWRLWTMYDTGNNNDTGTLVRDYGGNVPILTATAAVYRYMILFPTDTTNFGWKIIPTNTTSNNTANNKATIFTSAFNIFGGIYYYSHTDTVSANATIRADRIWKTYPVDIRYSFNCAATLTASKDVYIVAILQTPSTAKLRNPSATGDNAKATATGANAGPITQTLPTTEDGFIYIKLGKAYSTSAVDISYDHPIYWYKDGAIREYSTVTKGVIGLGNVENTKLSTWAGTTNVGTLKGLTLSGTAAASYIATFSGTTDATSSTGAAIINGGLLVKKKLYVTTAATLASTLSVTGAATLSGALTVAGAATLNGKLVGSSNNYGATLPSSGQTTGQIFFQTSNPVYELPTGGTTGLALVKVNATDRNVTWGGPYLPLSGGTMTGRFLNSLVSGGMWIKGTHEGAIYVNTATTAAAGNFFLSWFSGKTPSGAWGIGCLSGENNLYLSYGSDANYNANTNTVATIKFGAGGQVYGAVWNDYAEFRKDNKKETLEAGRCVSEIGDGSLRRTKHRLEYGCEIISDTYGFAIGEDKDNGYNTPIASSGRVLAYPFEDIETFRSHIGWPVCSGPNGTVSIMTEDEERRYPSRIIGTISEIPSYEEWGTGKVKVNGRVWIRIR